MMKRILILTAFITILYINAFAQHEEKIKSDAEIMVKATLNNDFKTLAQYTHPTLIRMMGGTDAMIALLNKSMAEMKSKGASIVDGIIGQPGKIIEIGKNLYSVVPQKVIMQSNGTKFFTNSSLLAISENKGESWYFLNVGSDNDENIKLLLPEISGKIDIPKGTKPIVITD